MANGTIIGVKANPKNPTQGFALISFPDRSTVEAWTPEIAKVEPLNGKPVPEDWSLRDNKAGTGKVLLPPKERQQTAYRNTKEAFEAEQASRLAWQQVEEERKDRRTALMTAVELLRPVQEKHETGEISASLGMAIADWMYEWLRSSPAGGPQSGVPTTEPAEAPQAGDTSSASQGRDGADTEPGEGKTTPSPGFPIPESECDHKGASGHWLPTKVVDGQARCPRCGASALIYKESA